MPKEKLTQKRAKDVLDYNPKTGAFTWKKSGPVKKGSKAGNLRKDGYVYIMINRKKYLAHRLAWLITHGYFPEHDVDHINRQKSDNRLINLREVSRTCNRRNCGLPKNNTSGIKGVNRNNKKWRASIKNPGRKLQILGHFTTRLEAAIARFRAELKYNWQACDESSSAYKFIKSKENGKDIIKKIMNEFQEPSLEDRS